MRHYYVYILASLRGTLYVGVTNDIARRVKEHRARTAGGFATRYKVTRLVYCEQARTATEAIEREKQIKRWRRQKKVALIENINPRWCDLGEVLLGQ